MPTFYYEARTSNGDIKSGEMDAVNLQTANTKLRGLGLTVSKLKKKPMSLVLRMPGSSGVTTKDLVIFTRQFATMIDAGLPLVQCLEILGTQMDNPEFKKVVMEVKITVESGKTLAEALRKHPKVFNRLFVNLVAAGESSGVLDAILNRLANYIEKNMKLSKQIKGAMVYPALVMLVSMGVTLVLLVFVIPIFQKMFGEFGHALPAMTQLVVNLSEFTRNNIFLILGGVVAAYFGGSAFIKHPRGRELLDTVALNMPIIGPLVQKVAVAKFTRTLGTMLSSGVNILDALEIVAGTAGNVVVERGLLKVRGKIAEGKPMAQPLSEMSVFPPMVVQMIAVGESTGAMDTMLNKIADFYDDEVDSAVGTMLSLLEPLIMTFLAVILGGLVVAMYLPVFSMAGAVGGG
jgi:type IV pilus assembly protein PilC